MIFGPFQMFNNVQPNRGPYCSLLHRPHPGRQGVWLEGGRDHARQEGRRVEVVVRRSSGRREKLRGQRRRKKCQRGDFWRERH